MSIEPSPITRVFKKAQTFFKLGLFLHDLASKYRAHLLPQNPEFIYGHGFEFICGHGFEMMVHKNGPSSFIRRVHHQDAAFFCASQR
jgi:hypothetical protein